MTRENLLATRGGAEHFYDSRLLDCHWPMHGLELAGEVLKKLFAENARKLLEQ